MHGSATTTPAIRAAIQTSTLSIRALARKYGLNPKTVAKWKSRPSTADLPMGPVRPRPKNLSAEDEGNCIGFRMHTLLPLDDCLYALQLMIPHLSRSSLHRLFQRHNISRVLSIPGTNIGTDKVSGGKSIGSFYVNAADIRTGDGKANMFFAFDRISKFAFAKLYEIEADDNGPAFLETLIEAVPYNVDSILTGDNPQIFGSTKNTLAAENHPFAVACEERGIDHELLPFDQPWRIRRRTAERSNPNEASARKFHYESHDHLQEHFSAFFDSYNFERRLKTLGGLTPYEFTCKCWETQPGLFHRNPVEITPKLKD
jgi:hypothetical protein